MRKMFTQERMLRRHFVALPIIANALIKKKKKKFLGVVNINSRVMSSGHLFSPDCLIKCCLLFKFDNALVLLVQRKQQIRALFRQYR